jgi:hypothetical protein
MPIKTAIVAVAAMLAVGGAAMAATLPANAETSACGSMCVDLYGGLPTTLNHPNFLIDSYKQGLATGTPIILFGISNSDPAEDFTIGVPELVSAYYAQNRVSAAVDQLYGGDTAYEFQYSPYGAPTGECMGVSATPVSGEGVTLQPCGVSGNTLWIADSSGSITDSLVPLINGSTPDASNPLVLTYPPDTLPTDMPNPVLEVNNLQENSAGQVPDNQLWSMLSGVLNAGAYLSIAQPANITTDATGPSGATVTYPLPAVYDPEDTTPSAAVCTPASGSVFPIGTTTVTCTATDAKDLNSPLHVTFTVTVLGAAAQLADLHQAVHGLGLGNILADFVATAQRELSAGHPRLACVTLTQFILEVQLQTPRFIPRSTAAQLISDAKRIQAVLGGCGPRLPF